MSGREGILWEEKKELGGCYRRNIKHRDVLSVWLVSLEKEKSNIGQMVKNWKISAKKRECQK